MGTVNADCRFDYEKREVFIKDNPIFTVPENMGFVKIAKHQIVFRNLHIPVLTVRIKMTYYHFCNELDYFNLMDAMYSHDNDVANYLAQNCMQNEMLNRFWALVINGYMRSRNMWNYTYKSNLSHCTGSHRAKGRDYLGMLFELVENREYMNRLYYVDDVDAFAESMKQFNPTAFETECALSQDEKENAASQPAQTKDADRPAKVEQPKECKQEPVSHEDDESELVGERTVDNSLKWLSRSYRKLPRTAQKSSGVHCTQILNKEFIDVMQEYDRIIVGKQGVFLVETKNVSGKIRIDAGGNWIRQRYDSQTEEGMRNPFEQVQRHHKLMASILPDTVPIIDIITMSNAKVIIEGAEHSKVKVIKSDLLVDFIENYPCERALSAEEIQNTYDVIMKYVQ